MPEVTVKDLLDKVREWEAQKALIQANYFVDQMESCTVVGKIAVVSNTAVSVMTESSSIRVDLAKADRVARATPGQLQLPTGAQMVQGEEYEDHYWAMMSSNAKFLLGKRKAT